MRKLIFTAAAVIWTGAAHAQAGPSQSGPDGRPESETEVVVDAPDRQVCRSVRRTGTRMRASRVCRTVAQWDAARQGRTADDEMADAADTLDALGADDISTNCVGNPLDRTPDTPLGPR